jgi:WD40 repeat protein
MSDKFTVKRLQLNVETEELGAAFSPDRTRVLIAVDRTMWLWDVETGRCLRVLEGHRACVVTAAWTSDQRHAISCDARGGIRVWNVFD